MLFVENIPISQIDGTRRRSTREGIFIVGRGFKRVVRQTHYLECKGVLIEFSGGPGFSQNNYGLQSDNLILQTRFPSIAYRAFLQLRDFQENSRICRSQRKQRVQPRLPQAR
jgi:hypothetical protein